MRRIRPDYAQAKRLTWCPECGNTRVIQRPRFGVDACYSCAVAAEADYCRVIRKHVKLSGPADAANIKPGLTGKPTDGGSRLMAHAIHAAKRADNQAERRANERATA